MEDLDEQEGAIDLAIGSGWLSRYEAGRLEVGEVLVSERLAGTGFGLRFNGEQLAEAEALVVQAGEKAYLGARIESLERQAPPAPEPARGEDITELLPFSILLARGKASLRQVRGLGRMSVIDFGAELDEAADGVLLVAGMEAARGKVCVVGENMGLRLTEILARPAADSAFRTSGKVIEPASAARRAKDYDFRRPDCFTKAQIDALTLLHLDFLRSFSLLTGMDSGGAALAVDQLNFTEFVDSLPEGTEVAVAPCFRAEREREGAYPELELLRLGTDPAFPEERVRSWVEHELDKPSSGAVLAAGALTRSRAPEIFTALRDAWKSRGALAPFPGETIRKPSGDRAALAFSDYADEYEMVALASIDLGAEGRLDIAYPLRAIESALKAFGA